ncbi:hypothetical protein [Pseudonocardia sp. TRM90224]|uniref:hypothetical protein n=1 Tax=Pseudonocardia sp. TRM90224 TaxID=2812678 RepID=UPI001E3AE0F5|nr:hypothetical protein [Pseudonocardia sp. TRM90224]
MSTTPDPGRWPRWVWPRLALAVAVLLVALVGVAIVLVDGAVTQLETERGGAGGGARLQLLPGSPEGALVELMRLIATPDESEPACSGALLDEDARTALAATLGARDCRSAVRHLRSRLADPGRYHRIEYSSLAIRQLPDGSVEVDGCGVRWQSNPFAPPEVAPGPAPGRVVTAPIYGMAWSITDVQPC